MATNRIWPSKKNVFQNVLDAHWTPDAVLKNTNPDTFTVKKYRWFKSAQCFYRHKHR